MTNLGLNFVFWCLCGETCFGFFLFQKHLATRSRTSQVIPMAMSINFQADHPAHRLGWWILASLMLHLFLLSVWSLIPRDLWHDTSAKRVETSQAPALTFIMLPDTAPPAPTTQPSKRLVVPTLPSQAVETENPNAILESDQNTRLKSREQGGDSNFPLPQQTGDSRSSLSYTQSPASRPTPQNSSPQPPSPQTPPSAQPSDPSPATEQLKSPTQLTPDGIPLFPQNTPKKTPQNPSTTPKPPSENKPSQAASAMSFARDKSQMTGSKNAEVGDNSPEAKSTDLGRYKSKMYRTIGSRWYLMVDQQMSLLAIGAIKIKFFVQANGVIRDIQVAEQNGRVEILEKICLRAVRDSGPFEPFNDNLKQQLGEGYWEDITFTIY
jgi:outer membrane biosynthesis protein TonB